MADNDKHPDKQDLSSIRERIDDVDARIQSLINERARLAQPGACTRITYCSPGKLSWLMISAGSTRMVSRCAWSLMMCRRCDTRRVR